MGRTPLHIACERGNLKLVTFMVENGAPLDAIDKSGCTPFHYAAGYDTKEEWNKNVSYRSSITHGTADPHRPPPPARVSGHPTHRGLDLIILISYLTSYHTTTTFDV